ncbi:zinc finger, CCHC-type containing protein [Tanacetum coccineum]
MLTSCYLLNRVPNKRNKTTPYELWYKKRLNLLILRVWGCRVGVRLPDPKKKTLGGKGIDCIFVGYAEHSKAYRFYVIEPNESVSINSIIESRDAIFDENQTIDDEIGSIMENNKWVLSDLPPGCKPLDKRKESVTYALVARITTIRLLLALAAIHNLVIHQMDVKTAFLNGDLDEEVYMKQPEGFVMPVLDIAFAVGKLSRFASNPSRQHWKAITRMFKYLRGTKDYGLSYVGYPSVLEGYTDASWISHVEDLSSTSEWLFLLGEGAISWASKK